MSLLANAAREAAQSASAAAIGAGTEPAAPTPAAPTAAAPAPAAPAPAAAAPSQPTPATDAAAIRTEARAAERDRIKAIVTHPEAEGRAAMAQHLAFSTDLAADTAGGLLATAPKAETAPQRTLTGATVPQPNVKPQAGGGDPGDAKASLGAAIQAELKSKRAG